VSFSLAPFSSGIQVRSSPISLAQREKQNTKGATPNAMRMVHDRGLLRDGAEPPS